MLSRFSTPTLALSCATLLALLSGCANTPVQDVLRLGESTTLTLEGAAEGAADGVAEGVAEGASGTPTQYQFKVKVAKPRAVSVASAKQHSGGTIPDAETITQLHCFDITYTYTGSNQKYATFNETLLHPQLTPTDDDGAVANTFTNANNLLCGTDPAKALPRNAQDLHVGRVYTDSVATFIADGPEPGFPASAVRLETQPEQHAQQVLVWTK